MYTCSEVQYEVEGLWVKVSRESSMGDSMVNDCYRPPNQEKETDKILKQQTETPKLQDLVLIGHFDYRDICWKGNTVMHKQPRKLLE